MAYPSISVSHRDWIDVCRSGVLRVSSHVCCIIIHMREVRADTKFALF